MKLMGGAWIPKPTGSEMESEATMKDGVPEGAKATTLLVHLTLVGELYVGVCSKGKHK